MAQKRKNSITDSLKKKGKELDLDAMKKKVEELHTEKEEVPQKEKIVRLSVDVPMSVYLEMKGEVLKNNSTIKKYVLGLIKNDLNIE